MRSDGPGRTGCALASGIFFIVLGALLLAQNLTELRLLDYADEALELFTRYWPLALIAWGAYKVYRRFSSPERSRVSALEVLGLLLLVAVGIGVGAAREAIERLRSSGLGSELASVLGPDVLGPTYRFEEETLFDLHPDAPLVVENRFGGLRAVGTDRNDLRVALDKRVHGTSEDEARDVAAGLHVELEGGTARVVGEDRSPVSADLEIEVPRSTPVVARVPGGRVTVVGIDAPVEIETGDDDVAAERLGATLRVTTSHGEIRVDGVAGDVTADSRHGSIRARRLGGDLQAETSRGSIAAEDVEGELVLTNRSGSIRVARAAGSVAIDATHTSVEIEKASMDVSVASSDRPVFIRDVGGRLRIVGQNTRIEVREVRGDVIIDNGLQPVRVTEIGGALTVRSSNGAVVAERLSGPAKIEATSEDVHVSRFASSLSLRSEHGALFAETDTLGGNLAIRSTYGDIELTLPASASFRIEAKSRDGELTSSLPGLDLAESVEDAARVFRGASEDARHEIELETEYGDIHLRRSGK